MNATAAARVEPADSAAALLNAMFDGLAAGPPIYLPSRFWTDLNRQGLALLADSGFENFKRTLAKNYFTWIISLKDPQFRFLMRHTKWSDWLGILNGCWRRDSTVALHWIRQAQFSIFCKMVWRYAEGRDRGNLLTKIEEPLLGNPFSLYLDGRLISQDLANSCLEYYSIREGFRGRNDRRPLVCELGAGYGRTAYFMLSAEPAWKYCIIDIPPALYVAQRYLSNVFPERRIFQFRSFDTFAEVAEEFTAADIAFLLPHQAELLPAGCCDLFVNISSLHEMNRAQIHAYMRMIDRLVNGYFYSKQWKVSVNPADNLIVTENDYPLPARWQTLYHRTPAIQRRFFEAMYKIE